MTFLQACQQLVMEVGIAGGVGPSTVKNQSAELGRAVSYVVIAYDYINGLWPEWDWKWVRETVTAEQGSDLAPLPGDANKPVDDYDLESLRVRPTGSDTLAPVQHMAFRDFDSRFGGRTSTGERPSFWTVRPDRRIQFNVTLTADLEVRYDYYHKPPSLKEDDDLILIPTPRLVVVRAKMIYAEREDAPEVMLGSGAEYEDLMQRLEGRYLPGSAGGRFHEHDLAVGLMSDYSAGHNGHRGG